LRAARRRRGSTRRFTKSANALRGFSAGGGGGPCGVGAESFSKVKAGIVHPLAVELRHSPDYAIVVIFAIVIVISARFLAASLSDDRHATANLFALANARRFFVHCTLR
jgi:hypothetical protein